MPNQKRYGIEPQGAKNAMAASLACMIEQILYPLEVIEARLQSNDGQGKNNIVPAYKGLANASAQIATSEGIRGLYRGVSISLIAANIAKTIFFGLYGIHKDKYEKIYDKSSHLPVILASTLASLYATALTNPIWVMRTRCMLSTKSQCTKEIIKEIYNTHGIFGFYRGLLISMFLSIQGAVQLAIYEYLNQINNKNPRGLEYVTRPAYNSTISKLIVSAVLYPLTVIRTRVQQPQSVGDIKIKYTGPWDCIKKTYHLEGMYGFYKGYIPNTLRTLPANALFFCSFEFFRKELFQLSSIYPILFIPSLVILVQSKVICMCIYTKLCFEYIEYHILIEGFVIIPPITIGNIVDQQWIL